MGSSIRTASAKVRFRLCFPAMSGSACVCRHREVFGSIGDWKYMKLPGLSQGAVAVDVVPDTLNEAKLNDPLEHGADAALTARAVIAVTFAGAGFWYLLWKLALLFVQGR